jgi:hypothetical protein
MDALALLEKDTEELRKFEKYRDSVQIIIGIYMSNKTFELFLLFFIIILYFSCRLDPRNWMQYSFTFETSQCRIPVKTDSR